MHNFISSILAVVFMAAFTTATPQVQAANPDTEYLAHARSIGAVVTDPKVAAWLMSDRNLQREFIEHIREIGVTLEQYKIAKERAPKPDQINIVKTLLLYDKIFPKGYPRQVDTLSAINKDLDNHVAISKIIAMQKDELQIVKTLIENKIKVNEENINDVKTLIENKIKVNEENINDVKILIADKIKVNEENIRAVHYLFHGSTQNNPILEVKEINEWSLEAVVALQAKPSADNHNSPALSSPSKEAIVRLAAVMDKVNKKTLNIEAQKVLVWAIRHGWAQPQANMKPGKVPNFIAKVITDKGQADPDEISATEFEIIDGDVGILSNQAKDLINHNNPKFIVLDDKLNASSSTLANGTALKKGEYIVFNSLQKSNPVPTDYTAAIIVEGSSPIHK